VGAGRRAAYLIDLAATAARSDGVVIILGVEHQDATGAWGPPEPAGGAALRHGGAPDALEREFAQVLPNVARDTPAGPGQVIVPPARFGTTLRQMLASGRGRVHFTAEGPYHPIRWDDEAAWEIEVVVTPDRGRERFVVEGFFVRDEQRIPVSSATALVRGGLFLADDTLHRYVDDGRFPVLTALATRARYTVSPSALLAVLGELHTLPRLPLLTLPEGHTLAPVAAVPTPRVRVRRVRDDATGPERLEATLAFDYAGETVDTADPRRSVFDRATNQLLQRSAEAEAAAREAALAAGLRDQEEAGLRLPDRRAADIATALRGQGFLVEMDGALLHTDLQVDLRVASGIDWFDVHGSASFDGTSVAWPELLKAARTGDRFVTLADGSVGLVPDEWMRRLSFLTATGAVTEGRVRYRSAQAGVLDALLASAPRVDVDAQFARVREALEHFRTVEPHDAPPGFHGELRPYQREGLGWLVFLQQLGFGGCLADDMGLGKTIQALALLESRRTSGAGPSLVVVPNSLVFNWQQEATRFTPELRVLAHVGPGRSRDPRTMADAHVVLTTYGILRRDAAFLARVPFDYVILDEAQAIKNAATASARAARVLKARHRLAMTGTPVENRLAELWSLFEFLNPGVLGASGRLVGALRAAAPEPGGTPDQEALDLLSRALRPYILRRTKAQVAPELPERVEQTVFVDLREEDRRRYDELRDHYRSALLGRIEAEGMGRAKVHVLEALLRLRQTACHPGLVNPAFAGAGSAKLDVLEESVLEVVEEGHKVLVFSQFTSLLAIVRQHFDRAGVTYEYLDGQTRDREARVTRFQEDPDCHVFLISLKAGGLGLNLTAADYVFLLDPWWNPAVEAQAIDRAHRIGQTRTVMATRLIARDTVEEKVLQLQERKRDLADAILRAEDGPLSSLTREDLELLLT
jgi:superfamily II DNA or RNA helicase